MALGEAIPVLLANAFCGHACLTYSAARMPA